MKKMELVTEIPMVKINYEYKGQKKNIYASLEYYSLTGSIKDRVAYYMIKEAKEKGELKENMPIIEVTSGNTGISLAAIGKYYNHEVYIFMPDWASKERITLMKKFGAKIKLVSKEDGGFKKCLEMAKEKALEVNGLWTNQFSNKYNFKAHYEITSNEIKNKIPEKPYAFISGIGTGGTIMGTGKGLKEKYSDLKIVAIEPEKMPLISKGKIISQHKIEGIGDDFIPELIDRNFFDDVILINDDDAVNMSKHLAEDLGLGVGISSGANFIGSVLAQENTDKPVVTIFADDNKKYLSTDLGNPISTDINFISNKIKLINFELIK